MRYVLIADDHEVTRRGIRDTLTDAFEGVEVAEAADADALLARLTEQAWDLVLLDVVMPGSRVVDTIAAIRARAPDLPVLVLTAATEVSYAVETLKAGANGFIQKHRAVDELVEAAKRVADGGSYLHADTAAEIASLLRVPAPDAPHTRLSAREADIFRRIALGQAVKEIAAELGLSDKTVATYLARIREKTGLTSHVDIARYALQHGLVD